MARGDWHHLQCIVIWVTKKALAWQPLVTIVKTERTCTMAQGMDPKAATRVIFITQEQVCLSWRVSRGSLRTVNNLLSMSVIIQCCSTMAISSDGGWRVILLRWSTGVEHPLVTSVHVGWPTHVWILVMVVTVMGMRTYGEKTAGFSLTRHSFQSNNLGLEISAVALSYGIIWTIHYHQVWEHDAAFKIISLIILTIDIKTASEKTFFPTFRILNYW